MAVKHSKQSRALFLLFVLIGLFGLLLYRRKISPKSAIQRVLSRNGYPQKTIDYWIAVSQFETNNWSSRVLKDSNNLFNIIVPGSNRLDYGEGQTIFDSYEDSVTGLINHVLKPFKYPMVFESPAALVAFMKSKNYFSSDLNSYTLGVEKYYNS